MFSLSSTCGTVLFIKVVMRHLNPSIKTPLKTDIMPLVHGRKATSATPSKKTSSSPKPDRCSFKQNPKKKETG